MKDIIVFKKRSEVKKFFDSIEHKKLSGDNFEYGEMGY